MFSSMSIHPNLQFREKKLGFWLKGVEGNGIFNHRGHGVYRMLRHP